MDLFKEEYKNLEMLTQEFMNNICQIWMRIFEPEDCKENLRKLKEHVSGHFMELVDESTNRKIYIENEINDLKKEADDLARRLHVELPCYRTENVPLLMVQSEMEQSLEDLREQLRMREEQIFELLLQQEALCEELGESPRALLADPLPTAEEIDQFKQYLNSLRNEKVERKKEVITLRQAIRSNLEILDLGVKSDIEHRLLNHSQIQFNKETFDGLKRMHDKYAAQAKELQEATDVMLNKLISLWERLQTSPDTRLKFKPCSNYNKRNHDAIYNELQRCEQLKRQNIKLYIQQIRDELHQMWDKTLKSEEERQHFTSSTSCDAYTDDVLKYLELELHSLKLYYTNNKQIFELYADRSTLCQRLSALEAKASEPGRFNNRGGQLLKEEKERKVIANKLPKIEQQIVELVQQYERKEQRPFLAYGKNIIDMFAEQREHKREKKEVLQPTRRKSLIPSTTNRNPVMRTPMAVSSGRKSASTMATMKQKTKHA